MYSIADPKVRRTPSPPQWCNQPFCPAIIRIPQFSLPFLSFPPFPSFISSLPSPMLQHFPPKRVMGGRRAHPTHLLVTTLPLYRNSPEMYVCFIRSTRYVYYPDSYSVGLCCHTGVKWLLLVAHTCSLYVKYFPCDRREQMSGPKPKSSQNVKIWQTN